MLSFIVPAHNEEALVDATVRSIAEAATTAGVAHEIVVVDDSSSDRTAEVAAAAGARVIAASCRHIAAARNAGARAATGDPIVFVDADTTIGAAVVDGVVRAIASGAVGGGAAMRFDEPVPRWVKVVLPVSNWLARRFGLTGGCFLFCSRRAFDAVGGFDETLFAAEEIALCRALRTQGPLTILREAVLTSGRKLRTYSGREILASVLRVARVGRRGVEDRSRLGIWYDPRRLDAARESHVAAQSKDR